MRKRQAPHVHVLASFTLVSLVSVFLSLSSSFLLCVIRSSLFLSSSGVVTATFLYTVCNARTYSQPCRLAVAANQEVRFSLLLYFFFFFSFLFFLPLSSSFFPSLATYSIIFFLFAAWMCGNVFLKVSQFIGFPVSFLIFIPSIDREEEKEEMYS